MAKKPLHYQTLRDLPPFSALIECTLETGRTHQIRVHLSEMGYGIIGDHVYGNPLRAAQMPDQLSRDILAGLRGFERQALHAAHLGFVHPITKQELAFDSPMPEDMQRLVTEIEQGIAKRAWYHIAVLVICLDDSHIYRRYRVKQIEES